MKLLTIQIDAYKDFDNFRISKHLSKVIRVTDIPVSITNNQFEQLIEHTVNLLNSRTNNQFQFKIFVYQEPALGYNHAIGSQLFRKWQHVLHYVCNRCNDSDFDFEAL